MQILCQDVFVKQEKSRYSVSVPYKSCNHIAFDNLSSGDGNVMIVQRLDYLMPLPYIVWMVG